MKRSTPLDRNIGAKVKYYRKLRGLSQKQLAAQLQTNGCDLTETMLCHIETGYRSTSIFEIDKLAEALKVDYNALFALDDAAAAEALATAAAVGEPLWRLPLASWHRDQCPSDYAITANSRPVPGGGPGGASNAAGFLSRFVPAEGCGWLHFDLAASYRDSGNGLWPSGATALGMATIAALLAAH